MAVKFLKRSIGFRLARARERRRTLLRDFTMDFYREPRGTCKLASGRMQYFYIDSVFPFSGYARGHHLIYMGLSLFFISRLLETLDDVDDGCYELSRVCDI